MTRSISRVWKPHLVLAVMMAAVTGPASAAAGQSSPQQTERLPIVITLDRREYSGGQTGTVRFEMSSELRSKLDYSFVRIRRVGSRQEGTWTMTCGWPVENGADKPCGWTAPTEPGEYEMYMTGAHTSLSNTVYGRTTFRVTPRRRASLRLVEARTTAVLGEEILVELTVPEPTAGDPMQGRLSWSVSGAQNKATAPEAPSSKGVDVSRMFRGGTFRVPIYAPWGKPGRFDLRLFQGNKVVGAVEVTVSKGWVEDGVVPTKTVYQTGEPIEFTVTLPRNRYYYGHFAGPSVLLFPLEIDGKATSKEEAIKMIDGCRTDCPGWLSGVARGDGTNPHDDGISIAPGRYRVASDTVKGNTRPHIAAVPGRYELRLYDRGPELPLSEYADLFIAASREIVVEPAGDTPSSLRFARLKSPAAARPARASGTASRVAGTVAADYEELAQLTLGEIFYVVAAFDAAASLAEPAERTVTVEWGSGEARQVRNVVLTRRSPGVYVSIPLLPAAPEVVAKGPALPTADARPGLDEAIARLSADIEARRDKTETTVAPLPGLDGLSEEAARNRRSYETMRVRLYMGHPKPDSEAARAFVTFDEHWGPLAAKIWAGDRQAAAISPAAWGHVVRRVRGGNCPIAAALPGELAGALERPGWACMSDVFFEDLADYEARANRLISVAREEALSPLREALDDLDEWIARTEGLRREAPGSVELRRQAAWHLHKVWLAGATARRDELRRVRDRSPESAFQQFLLHAPAIVRPDDRGSIRIAAGQKITARLGNAVREATVVVSPAAALAAELHDVHYKIRTLESRLDEDDARELRRFLSWANGEMRDSNLPPDSSLVSQAAADKEAALRAARPGKYAAERATLEAKRREIVRVIAAR